MEPDAPTGTVDVYPVEKQHVKVAVEVQHRAEALDEGDRTRAGGRVSQTGPLDQVWWSDLP